MDNRKLLASFSVKVGTKRSRIELSPAELHGGPTGCWRVRIDRRWHDSPEGQTLCLDKERIAALVVDLVLGGPSDLLPSVAYPKNARAVVRYELDGVEHCEQATLKSQPVRLYDGRNYVCVHTYERGTWFAPYESITIKGGYYASNI